jgi:hypothetical protein
VEGTDPGGFRTGGGRTSREAGQGEGGVQVASCLSHPGQARPAPAMRVVGAFGFVQRPRGGGAAGAFAPEGLGSLLHSIGSAKTSAPVAP